MAPGWAGHGTVRAAAGSVPAEGSPGGAVVVSGGSAVSVDEGVEEARCGAVEVGVTVGDAAGDVRVDDQGGALVGVKKVSGLVFVPGFSGR